MHPLQWMFSLVDGISGPAKAITRSLKSVQGGMGSMAGRVKGVASSIGDGLAKFGLIAQGARAVTGALSSVASGAADFGKFVVDSASFKRNTLAAFELMEGSADKAKETWDTIKAFSDRTPFETADVMEQFKQLRGAGYSTAQVQNVLSGVFDVAAMQGSKGKEAAGRIVETIAKLKGTDRADGDILKTISEASGGGVNLGDLYDAIARGRKVSRDAAKQLVSAGKVGGDEATKAILDVVQTKVDKGGPLGSAMEKFGSGSWEGQLSTLKSRMASLFEDVNISPLIGGFTRLNATLSGSSETGQRLRATIGAIADKVGAGLDALLSQGNIDAALGFAADALDTIYGIMVAAWPYVEAFGGGIWDGLKAALGPVLEGFREAFGGGDSSIANPRIIEGIKALATAVGWVLGKVVGVAAAFVKWGTYATGAIAYVTGFLVESWDTIKVVLETVGLVVGAVLLAPLAAVGMAVALMAAPFVAAGVAIYGAFKFIIGEGEDFMATLGGWWDSFVSIGSDIVDGIWEGISGAWDTLTGNTKDIAKDLPAAVREQLGIHSPSRVFMEIGRNTMSGMTLGIQQEAANTNATMARAVEVPATVAPGNASRTVSVGGVTVHVHIATSTNASPDDIADAAVNALEDRLPAMLEAHLADAAA